MSFIAGFGSYLPARVVANAEIAALAGCREEWIVEVSGIRERRYASDEESVAGLGVRAARDCLERAGVDAASLGFVMLATGSAERRFPGPAARVAHELGLSTTPALDLPMASAGSLAGLALAARLAPAYGPVLVVGAEKMSAVIHQAPLDPNTAILFGDGAGACLVHPDRGQARIVDSVLCTDGAFTEDLKLEFNRPLEMNGRSVILQASRKIPRALMDLLSRHGRTPQEVQAFLMHQANQNLITRVAQALGVPAERFPSCLARYGNTSAASLLIMAAEWARETGFCPGAPLCLAAFGAGFHWGAVLVEGV